MTCERNIERIQELVDGTLGAIRRSELEQHLAGCESCRALRDDLARIRDAAAALPPLPPPDGAWLQIAGRLRQEGRVRETAPVASRHISYAWLGIAAALVLAAAVSVMVVLRSTPSAPPAAAPAVAGNTPGTDSVQAAQTAVEAAQAEYEKAIGNLQKAARDHMDALDPQTSTVIEKNLGILDQAIAENRAAVKAEPTSVAARGMLFEALRQKVSLLQDTISLINEMRKGNNAAAAQLLNKS
jgi:anti-sigma factor RsiW